MGQPLSPELLAHLTPALVEGARLSRDFKGFLRGAWNVIEPEPLVTQGSFHIDCIAEHLSAVDSGQIKNLLINVPPGFSKSSLVSVLWPAHSWTHSPGLRWHCSSYDQDLALRDARRSRNIIRSEWFRARWPQVVIREDQDAKGRFETTTGGFRLSTVVGGHGTGEHPNRIVVDDPHNRETVMSDLERKAVIDWWDLTMSTRGVATNVKKVVIMQRLHVADLSGRILETDPSFVHICLPMRYEPKRMMVTPLGWNDPRTVPGQLLDPVRFPEHVVVQMEKALASFGSAGQLQQRPIPIGGGLIQRRFLRFWQPQGEDLGPVRDPETNEPYLVVQRPEAFEQQIQSWDMSFKDELGQVRKGRPPDPVSGLVFGRRLASIYLLDRVNKRMDVLASAKAVLDMSKRWPEAMVRLIEDKANGPAVRAILRTHGVITQPVTPEGSKVGRVVEGSKNQKDRDARAMSMQAMIEAGEFFLPHPGIAPWVWAYVAELTGFPTYPTDDDVDSTSQAFLYFQRFIDRALVEAADATSIIPFPKTTDEIVRRQLKALMDEEMREAQAYEDQQFSDGPSSPWLSN